MTDELVVTKASELPLLLEFEKSLACPKQYEREDRDRIQFALTKLAEWWFSAMSGEQNGLFVDIKAERTMKKHPESDACIYFRIHTPLRSTPVNAVLVSIQHQHAGLHDHLQIPDAAFKKLGGWYASLFEQIRSELKYLHPDQISIRLSGIIDNRTSNVIEVVTSSILKLVAALRPDDAA